MKKIVPIVTLAVLSVSASANTVEDRLEDLEMSRDLNWIKWSGSLETRYDHYSRDVKKEFTTLPTSGAPEVFSEKVYTDNYYRLWANLNVEARPSDRLSFFGRLSTAKYFSTIGTNGDPAPSFPDLGSGQQISDSRVFLERAFANYKISDSFVFTMGRLPTIDGPNKHVALNQQLSGNYPSLAYSAIFDGLGLTYSKNMGRSADFRAKVIYVPLSNVNFAGSAPLTDFNGKEISTTSGFTSLLLEYEKTNGSFFKKNLNIFQWVHADQTPIYNKTTTAIQSPFDGNFHTVNIGSDLNFAVDRLVGYTEFEGIFNSDFDFAAQFMYSKLRSRGDLLNCVSQTGAGLCDAIGMGGVQGWNTDKASADMDGTAYALTLRYQTPWKAINRPKVGVEYINASEKAYVFDQGNINPINAYASPNSSIYHAFWNQSFDGGLYMNVGYMYRQQDTVHQAFTFFGKGQEADNVDQNLYVSFLATF